MISCVALRVALHFTSHFSHCLHSNFALFFCLSAALRWMGSNVRRIDRKWHDRTAHGTSRASRNALFSTNANIVGRAIRKEIKTRICSFLALGLSLADSECVCRGAVAIRRANDAIQVHTETMSNFTTFFRRSTLYRGTTNLLAISCRYELKARIKWNICKKLLRCSHRESDSSRRFHIFGHSRPIARNTSYHLFAKMNYWYAREIIVHANAHEIALSHSSFSRLR